MNKDIHIDSLTSNDINKKLKESSQSIWLPFYHIYPPFGLLNDPNGLSYINDKYNIYFQWYPGGPTHGLKHWFKLSSIDLINYVVDGVKLKPEVIDNGGCFSGSYYKDRIVYTCNQNDNGIINQVQAISDLVDGEIVNKKVIIENLHYVKNEFRDPSFFNQDDKDYLIFIALPALFSFLFTLLFVSFTLH